MHRHMETLTNTPPHRHPYFHIHTLPHSAKDSHIQRHTFPQQEYTMHRHTDMHTASPHCPPTAPHPLLQAQSAPLPVQDQTLRGCANSRAKPQPPGRCADEDRACEKVLGPPESASHRGLHAHLGAGLILQGPRDTSTPSSQGLQARSPTEDPRSLLGTICSLASPPPSNPMSPPWEPGRRD